MDDVIYATDSSDKMGAIVKRPARVEIGRALWRTGRRKGGYARMLFREEAMIRKIDSMKEEFSSIPPWGEPEDAHPERPIAFRFHFAEVCGGAGKVSNFSQRWDGR